MKRILYGLLALCLLATSAPAAITPQSGTILWAQKPDGTYVQVQVDSSGNFVITANSGCRGASTNPTPVSDGTTTSAQCDLGGETVTMPYANKGNQARGTGSATGTGATTIMAASGAAANYEYMTGLQCGRSDAGTTAIFITLNDSASSIFVIPGSAGGGGTNVVLQTPLRFPKNTAGTFTPSAGVSTLYCNAQGFNGP